MKEGRSTQVGLLRFERMCKAELELEDYVEL